MSTPAAEAVSETGKSDVRPRREVIHRHSWLVRLTHWINALTIFIMVGSGLNIFNAHPRLYWGQYGADADRAFFELGATGSEDDPRGFAALLGHRIGTTGILGVSAGSDGDPLIQGFPSWSTLPSWRDLAT